MGLQLGAKYKSFAELEEAIEKYKQQYFVELVKRDIKRLESETVRKKCPQRVDTANKDLKYYSIKYTCAKGGKPYRMKKHTTERKRRTSSSKENCPFSIRCSLSVDGNFLVISSLGPDHNHPCEREAFRHLPKQRRLAGADREEVLGLLNLNCNKKLVKNFIKSKYGKIVTLKDLSNLKSCTKNTSKNELLETVNYLNSFPNASVEVLVNENNILEGIYFQDEKMKQSFQAYPELLLCDGTFKLNNLNMPLYILSIINGNNEGIVVATFILSSENTLTITHMINIFKLKNSCWDKTITIFTDKDFKERKAFSLEFPKAKMFLCLFHTLKSFRTSITCEAMGITSYDRTVCLDILQKMAYCRTNNEYIECYNTLMGTDYTKVKDFFNKNWHPIKEEWVDAFKKEVPTFNVTTTNSLESINHKLKQVVTKLSTIKIFFQDLIIALQVMRDEKATKAFNLLNKKVLHSFEAESPQEKYLCLTTPYAFKFIEKSFEKSKSVKILKEHDIYFTLSRYGNIEISENYCTCSFFKNMGLVCCHILALLALLKKDLFDENLVNKRFHKKYYIDNEIKLCDHTDSNANVETEYNDCQNSGNNNENILENISIAKVAYQKSVLSVHQKYRKSMDVCSKISSFLSEYGQQKFNDVFQQLENALELIKNRREFLVVEVSQDTQNVNVIDEINQGFEVQSTDIENNMMQIDNTDVSNLVDPNVQLDIGKSIGSYEKYTEAFEHKEPHLLSSDCEEPITSNNTNNNELLPSQDNSALLVEVTSIANSRDETSCQLEDIAEVQEQSHQTHQTSNAMIKKDISLDFSKIQINKLKGKTIGRPKGLGQTVIGLKKKKNKDIFTRQSLLTKRRKILNAILAPDSEELINDVLFKKRKLTDVNLSSYEQLDNFLLEPEVEVGLVEIFFDQNTFKRLEAFIKLKSDDQDKTYFCYMCKNRLKEQAIRCHSCLMWVDISCTSLTRVPKGSRKWFCMQCNSVV